MIYKNKSPPILGVLACPLRGARGFKVGVFGKTLPRFTPVHASQRCPWKPGQGIRNCANIKVNINPIKKILKTETY